MSYFGLPPEERTQISSSTAHIFLFLSLAYLDSGNREIARRAFRSQYCNSTNCRECLPLKSTLELRHVIGARFMQDKARFWRQTSLFLYYFHQIVRFVNPSEARNLRVSRPIIFKLEDANEMHIYWSNQLASIGDWWFWTASWVRHGVSLKLANSSLMSLRNWKHI